MRILMISDIHANLPALLTLESEIEVADLTLVGGDLIGYYCDVNEVIAFVIRHGLTCVRGNHDHYLLHGVPDRVQPHVKWALAYAERVITPDHRAYLASLPLIWSQVVDGRHEEEPAVARQVRARRRCGHAVTLASCSRRAARRRRRH